MNMDCTASASGSAVICDPRGNIRKVVSDCLDIFTKDSDDLDLFHYVDHGSWSKLSEFLDLIGSNRSAMGWELVTSADKGIAPLYYFGVIHEHDSYFIVISPMPENLIFLYDQMISIVNEQSVLLRQCQQNMCANCDKGQTDDEGLDEMMRLNNELVNAQRELNRKNLLLQRQEERARRLFEFNPDAQILLSEQGEVVEANSAAQRLFDLGQHNLSALRMKLPDAEGKAQELCITCNGTSKTVEVRTIRIEWESEPVILVALRDITERKELESLKEDVERISRHDLKNPLGGIVSMAEYLEEATDEQTAGMIGLMGEAARKTIDMINSSLDLYKMETGTYVLERVAVDMKGLIERVVDDHRALVSGKRIEVKVEGPQQGRATFPGEESLYQTMLANLVKNALEAAPRESCVFIKWGWEGERASLTIHNDGAVPASIRDTFFEKYSTAHKRGGSGLGTYSANLIARTLGGSLVMRTAENKGTTLRFILEG